MDTTTQDMTEQRIADLAPTDVLADMLPKLDGNSDAYKVVVKALGRRVDDEAAARALMRVRNECVIALAGMRVRNADVIEWAIEATEHWRLLSNEALVAAIDIFATQHHPRVLLTLVSLVSHHTAGLAVIKHLNNRQEPEAIDGIMKALSNENMLHREAAAYALKPRHEKRVTDALMQASSRERDAQALYAIIGALIGRDDEAVLPIIVPHIGRWHIPFEYFLNPQGILDDDFQKRKHWGQFNQKRAIRMVEGMIRSGCYTTML